MKPIIQEYNRLRDNWIYRSYKEDLGHTHILCLYKNEGGQLVKMTTSNLYGWMCYIEKNFCKKAIQYGEQLNYMELL